MSDNEPSTKPQNDPEESAWRKFETDQAFATFKARGAALLRDEGIAGNDPRLVEAFKRHAKQGEPGNFEYALARAVADVRKAEVREEKDSTPAAADAARSDERARLKKERERRYGPDREEPATPAPKDWNRASDQEVLDESKRRRERLHRFRINQY